MRFHVLNGTPVWRIDPRRFEPECLQPAASILQRGGVVVYPTETFYGLGANPMSESAVGRIFFIKGRDYTKPLPLIACDDDAVRRAAAEWPSVAEKAADMFWPGPLTLILNAASSLPSSLSSGTGKIAVRVSSHPIARALAAATGGLLTSTSANEASRPPGKELAELSGRLLTEVDGIIDGGILPGGASFNYRRCDRPPPASRAFRLSAGSGRFKGLRPLFVIRF